MRLAAAYFPPPVLLKAAAYMCAYCYCLKAHLRQGRKRKDPSDPTAYKDNPKQVDLPAVCTDCTCLHERVGIRAACVLQMCAASPLLVRRKCVPVYHPLLCTSRTEYIGNKPTSRGACAGTTGQCGHSEHQGCAVTFVLRQWGCLETSPHSGSCGCMLQPQDRAGTPKLTGGACKGGS